jgi:hypothetical protein
LTLALYSTAQARVIAAADAFVAPSCDSGGLGAL